MDKVLICPDVSEYQVPLDRTFTRDFIIFRVTFGAHYLDPHFLANANAAKRLHDEGRLAGVLLYVVYTSDPVREQFEFAWDAIGPKVPDWLTGIMIDVETWRGHSYELSGNHSQPINRLYGMHAHRMGSYDSVIAYGNAGDLAELYPGRDHRCRVILANYSPTLAYRKVRGAVGQQYTDGQPKWGVPRVRGGSLPRASAPFGHCDHNVFPDCSTGKDLVRLLRPAQLDGSSPEPEPAPENTANHGSHLPRPDGAHRRNRLVSPSGDYALVLGDDGTLEVRHRGTRHTVVQEVT
jgi:hypothetical protein